ncbi:superoxide dismutase [Rhodomicrobium vannielii]
MHADAGHAQAAPETTGAAPAPAAAPPAATGPFTLPPLPYPPDRNAPSIDAETMSLHHDKHHAAYVNNLNQAVAGHPEVAAKPLHEILANLNSVPEPIRTAVRNNAGGHANHSMFWTIMGGKGGEPTGELKQAIARDFGSFATMQEQFNAAGGKVFGSGWVFVTVTPDGKLAMVSRPNQDTPLMEGGRVLFGNDVWEHAYYLTYRNRRPDYLKAWWSVVDWGKVGERYAEAKTGKLTT